MIASLRDPPPRLPPLLLLLLPLLLGACDGPRGSPADDPARQVSGLLEARRHAEAARVLEQAVATRERTLGPDHPAMGASLDALAYVYQLQGRYAEAGPLHRRALALAERAFGPDHPHVALVLDHLGVLRRLEGRHAEAEPLHRRALAIREGTLGPDHPDVAASLANLASVYLLQDRHPEAATLLERALAIDERALGPDHPLTVAILANLALAYQGQGRPAEAGPLLARALAIREGTLGPDHPDLAASLNNLGTFHLLQGRPAEAGPLLERALATNERALGPDHPGVAASLDNLAVALERQGRPAEAEPLHRRALAIDERALGPDHPEVATILVNLALAQAERGRLDEAMATVRRAAAAQEGRIGLDAGPLERPLPAGADGRLAFGNLVGIAWRAAELDPGRRPALADEAFRAGQRVGETDAAAALARVAARFAAGDDELARAVREREDAVVRLRGLDAALVGAAARRPDERDRAAEDRLRRELAAATAALGALDRGLARRFPAYGELTRPDPLGLEEARALLAPGEALLAYALLSGAGRGEPAREEGYVWLVRADGAEMARLALGPGELVAGVRALRARLDPERWPGAAPPAFDAALAHRLYRALLPFAPDRLAGVRHLLVVPDGPLESLPFSVLVRTPPEPDAPYREVDWLARSLATTTLPSVSSLRALRRLAEPSRAVEPFRGVGDPALDGPPGPARGIDLARLLTRGLADPAEVRRLPPLPETADELRSLARDLGAGEGSVLLRERATEAAVKAGALAGARVVAFATHAGVAGELPGLAEPALVLTPPAAASEADDGLLTASEAARLSLDADIVLLSACNTAAPDGTPEAPALSGLAKAFLYAGSRSLLVSHWYVISDAAARLTTGMFAELAREPGIGRAEALRRAEMALLDGPPAPYLAHPAAWAPFVVVGEGGAAAGAAGP